jgi:hypothetical protein
LDLAKEGVRGLSRPGGHVVDANVLLDDIERVLAALHELLGASKARVAMNAEKGQSNRPARGLLVIVLDLGDVLEVARVSPTKER